MPWLALLKRPKILIIIALVIGGGAYIGWQHIKVANLRADVAELQGEISRKESQIGTLTASVQRQNDAVDEWKAKAQSRAEAAHKAMREAEALRQETSERIGRIKAESVISCEEGVNLLRRELGL